MKRLFNYLLLLPIMVMIGSCQSDLNDGMDENPLISNQFENDKAIIAKLGFDSESVVDMGDTYVVEGDIVLEKKYLSEYGKLPEEIDTDGVATKQSYQPGGLIDKTRVGNILVGIDSSIPAYSDWYYAITGALQEWSNISGCAVKLSYTTSSTADIIIRQGYLGSPSAIAEAKFPVDGKPGASVTISYNYSSLTASQKLFTVVHELGHCLGLRHTNWRANGETSMPATLVPGTSEIDNNSVMNSVVNNWAGFTTGDITAIKYLYPFNEKAYFTNIKKAGNTVQATLHVPGKVELTMQVGLHYSSSSENPEAVFYSGVGGSIVVNKNNISNPANATKTFGYEKGEYSVSFTLTGATNQNTEGGVSIIGIKTSSGSNYSIGSPAYIGVGLD